MSKVEQVVLATKPFRPTDYNEKAMTAVLEESFLIADVKKDGVRLNLCVQSSKGSGQIFVDWLSREGKRFPAMIQPDGLEPLDCENERWAKFFNPHLGEALFPEGFMLDAELIMLDAEGNEVPCKTTSGNLRRKSQSVELNALRVYVFDIVPIEVIHTGQEYDTFTSVRKMHVEYQVERLKKYFPEIDWRVAETYEVFSMETMPTIERESQDEEGNEVTVTLQPPLSLEHLYEAVRARGEEGLVVKDPMGSYRRSKCSGWWKMVPDDNEDGKVVGLVWGSPGKANEGKVIGFEVLLESGHVVNACKISKALMEEFTKAVLAATLKVTMDFTQEKAVNPYAGYTVRVTFMERYPDGSLRHPSFDCFRGISDPLIKE